MQLAPQQQQPFPILNVEPLAYSYIKLLSIFVGLAAIDAILFIYCYKIAIGLLLMIPFGLGYLKLVNHSILIDLFYRIEEDRQDITQYAIYDLSFNLSQHTNNRKANKIYVVSIHYTKDKVKFFYFKEELFKIQKNVVSRVNQLDTIKILQIDQFREFTRLGLAQKRLEISQQLFQPQKKYMHSNIYNFILKRLYEEKEWILLNTFLLLVSFLCPQSILISIILILINLIIFALIAYDQNKKVQTFKQKFIFLSQKKFSIFREGQTKIVNFDQILVGDIIQIEKTQQMQCLTYFKSLLIGNFQIICKYGESKQQFIKSPARTVNDLNEDRRNRYVIKPLSFIQKASLRGNQHLFILQNNYISKFFNLWFNKEYYHQFQPTFRPQTIKLIQLYAIAITILILFYIVMSLILGQNITQPFKQQIFGPIIAIIQLLAAIIHLLLCLNHSKSIRLLQQSEISMFGVNVSTAGSIKNMIINFQQLLQVQFQQILYKNLIFDPSSRPFQPDSTTLQSGRTYESLLALIFYISLGYLDEQQNKPTFLRQIYKLYEEYYELEDSLYDYKNIVHKSSKKIWRVVHKDFQNEQGARSWRIQYENQMKYVILQCNIKDRSIFERYIGAQDKNRLNNYIELADNLLQEGKRVKLILFKNYRKEHTGIRGTQSFQQSQDQFQIVDRSLLQKNLQFAAFVIFDNAIKQQKLKTIELLRNLKGQKQKLFNLFIYSQNKNESLAGFEHILQNIPIYYQFKSHEKASCMRQKMKQHGTIILSRDIQDQYAELLSDISIKTQSNLRSNHNLSQFVTPSDLYLSSMQSMKQLLKISNHSIKFKMEVIKYALIIGFLMELGVIWIGIHKGQIQSLFLWIFILFLSFLLFPFLFSNQLFFNKTLTHYKFFPSIHTITFFTQILFNLFLSIFIIFFMHQFPLCSHSLHQSHTLAFRIHQSQGNSSYKCMNIPLLLVGSASFLSFAIFHQESQASKFQLWKFFIGLIWLILMIIAQLPLKIILFCLGIMIFLILLKILIKFAGRQSKESSNNPPQ